MLGLSEDPRSAAAAAVGAASLGTIGLGRGHEDALRLLHVHLSIREVGEQVRCDERPLKGQREAEELKQVGVSVEHDDLMGQS